SFRRHAEVSICLSLMSRPRDRPRPAIPWLGWLVTSARRSRLWKYNTGTPVTACHAATSCHTIVVSEGAHMTMLDRMSRHRNWLKWSLGLVCLAFVIFYIPDFLRGTGADAASGDSIARVAGHDITAGEFRRTYQAQLQAYRSAYGGQMSDQLLKQLGIEQQILQQMVDERAALAEAELVGIDVSEEEIRERIFAMPAFQENGAFIGEARYTQLLRMQRPP